MLVVTVIQGLFATNLLLHFRGCSFFPRLNHKSKTTSNCLTGLQQLWCDLTENLSMVTKFTHAANSKSWIFSALSKLTLLLEKICGGCHGNVLPIFSFLKIAQYCPHFLILLATDKNLWRPGKEFSWCISWALVQHHSNPI